MITDTCLSAHYYRLPSSVCIFSYLESSGRDNLCDFLGFSVFYYSGLGVTITYYNYFALTGEALLLPNRILKGVTRHTCEALGVEPPADVGLVLAAVGHVELLLEVADLGAERQQLRARGLRGLQVKEHVATIMNMSPKGASNITLEGFSLVLLELTA